MRILWDNILRAGIKLCMLTGVTFMVTACYGTPNPPERDGEAYQRDQQQLEQQIATAAEQNNTLN